MRWSYRWACGDDKVQWAGYPFPRWAPPSAEQPWEGRWSRERSCKRGSSLPTSLVAAQVRDALAEGESERSDTHTHEDTGVSQGHPGARQPGEGQVLWWHILRQQGHLKAVSNWSDDCKENKKKGKKNVKKLRSADLGLDFLSPVEKENCCQKYKYLNSLRQQGSKWLLLPVTEESSAARCKPEGFASSPELETLWNRNPAP